MTCRRLGLCSAASNIATTASWIGLFEYVLRTAWCKGTIRSYKSKEACGNGKLTKIFLTSPLLCSALASKAEEQQGVIILPHAINLIFEHQPSSLHRASSTSQNDAMNLLIFACARSFSSGPSKSPMLSWYSCNKILWCYISLFLWWPMSTSI